LECEFDGLPVAPLTGKHAIDAVIAIARAFDEFIAQL
jgi:hypothetical protein